MCLCHSSSQRVTQFRVDLVFFLQYFDFCMFFFRTHHFYWSTWRDFVWKWNCSGSHHLLACSQRSACGGRMCVRPSARYCATLFFSCTFVHSLSQLFISSFLQVLLQNCLCDREAKDTVPPSMNTEPQGSLWALEHKFLSFAHVLIHIFFFFNTLVCHMLWCVYWFFKLPDTVLFA